MSKSGTDKLEKWILKQMQQDPADVAKKNSMTNMVILFGKKGAKDAVVELALTETETVATMKANGAAPSRIAKFQKTMSELQDDWVGYSKKIQPLK